MTRERAAAAAAYAAVAVVATALASSVAGFVALRALDRPLVLWALAWALVALSVVLRRPDRERLVYVPLATTLATVTFAGACWLHVQPDGEGLVLDRVVVAGFEVRLVGDVRDGTAVRVRTRHGPFSREWTAWATPSYDGGGVLIVTGERSVNVVLDGGVRVVTL